MSARGNAYMDVTPLTNLQMDQPVYVSPDNKHYYGYGYRVEMLGDLFVLRFEQVAGESKRGRTDQPSDRRISQQGPPWPVGETRRH